MLHCSNTFESNFFSNLRRSASWCLVKLRNYDVSRMRHDCTEDTSDVTSGECNDELLRFAALVTWLRYDVLVQSLESTLETRELHHCVRNLSAPERHKTFVETRNEKNRE